ncbi:MAG: ComF family protein [Patescibacteria group bacterium]|nr:ComF family protein [Patescibacteria group bacterium]MCL5257726.1 ComF family protein [Patescibacteria group bacterium]
MDILKLYQKTKEGLTQVLAPSFCFNCQKLLRDQYLCSNCLLETNFSLDLCCPFCDRRKPFIVNPAKICCHNFLSSLIYFGQYENKPINQLIKTAKYQGYFTIFDWLGGLMAGKLKQLRFSPDYKLVPIPLHPKRFKERGFNQAEVIANQISSLTGLEVKNSLIRIINNQSQASLTGKDREQNVKGIFKTIEPTPKKIILIDDVWTTGATLIEASKTLKANNAKIIIGLTILK